ncbi:MAG: hypothetical protein PHQ27_00525 [Victivallales bacterium]|nr:hypothetical protein [Victivallales bacterium]
MADESSAGIHFIERKEIARVIAEQKLSQSGLVSPQTLARLGKILQAEIMVLLQPGAGSPRLVIMAARTGIRLADTPLIRAAPEQQSAAIVQALIAARDKIKRFHKQQVALISFFPLNMITDGDPERDSAARLQTRLEQKLLQHKQLVILEREYLDALCDEKAVSHLDLTHILAGTYTIELEARKINTKSNNITVACFIRPVHGSYQMLGKWEYPLGRENEVATAFAAAVPVAVQKYYSPITDNITEAQLFMTDGEQAFKNNDFDKGLISLQNAFMLNPKLQTQINEILIHMIENHIFLFHQYSYRWSKEQICLYTAQFLRQIKIMDTYHRINGEYYHCYFFLDNFSRFPLKAQNEFREFYHRYFMAIKKQGSTSPSSPSLPWKQQEAFLQNLVKITPTSWTCEYWQQYILPVAKDYLHAAAPYYRQHPEQLTENIVDKIIIEQFNNGDGIFSPAAYNGNLDLIREAVNSGVLIWQFTALVKSQSIRSNIMAIGLSTTTPTPYKKNFSDAVNIFYLPGFYCYQKSDYVIFKYFLRHGKDIPPALHKGFAKTIYRYIEQYILVNGKVNRELSILLLKAGFSGEEVISSIHANFYHLGPNSIIQKLRHLQHDVAPLNNVAFNRLLQKKIIDITPNNRAVAITTRGKNAAKLPDSCSYYFSKGTSNNPISAFSDGNKIFVVMKYGRSCQLVTLPPAKVPPKAVAPKLFTTEQTMPENNFDSILVICKSRAIVCSNSDPHGLYILPLDGGKTSFVDLKINSEYHILGACATRNAVFLVVRPYNYVGAKGAKLPMKILRFDPEDQSIKTIFSFNQILNNPFKDLDHYSIYRVAVNSSNHTFIFPVQMGYSDHYRYRYHPFNIDTGGWMPPVRWPQCQQNAFPRIAGSLLVRGGEKFVIYDLDPNGQALKQFAAINKLTGIRQRDSFTTLYCHFERNGQNIFSGENISDNVLWNYRSMFFLPQRKMVLTAIGCRIINIVFCHGCRYCVYYIFNDKQDRIEIYAEPIPDDGILVPLGTSLYHFEVIYDK